MILHLYCILPAGAGPQEHTVGVDGVPVHVVEGAGLATWVTRHERAPTADAAAVRAHNDVVVAAMTPAVTPVPLRFGQAAPDEDAVQRSIAADAGRWLDLLQRFAGHAEYGVRIAPADGSTRDTARDVHTSDVHTGKEYMAALARRQAAAASWKADAERIAADLLARANGLVRDSRFDPPAAPGGMFALAHLVAWNASDAYHAVVDGLRTAHRELRFLRSGPWPPYSFVA